MAKVAKKEISMEEALWKSADKLRGSVEPADIKASMRFDLAVLLKRYGDPPVTIDDVYKEVLEQAENFKKYAE